MFKKPAGIYLTLICLIHIIFVLLNNPGAPSADALVYSEEARNLNSGSWELGESPKNHRFGLLLPAALFTGIFGDSPYVLLLWPLLCSLITLVVLYKLMLRYSSLETAILAASMLALNLNHIIYSSALFPDVPVAMYFFLIIAGLYYGIREKKMSYGILSGALMLPALFTRENILFILPATLVLSFFFLQDRDSRKVFIGFFSAAITAVMCWIGTFAALSGDLRFVYETVEENHNVVFANYEALALFERFFIFAPRMLLGSLSFVPLLILTAPVVLSVLIKRGEWKDLTTWWTTYFIVLLVTFWFGTSSFSQWSPLPLFERLWLPLAAPLSVLSAISIKEAVVNDPNRMYRRTVFVLFVVLMVVSLYVQGWERFVFYAFMLVMLEAIWYRVSEEGQKRLWNLLLALTPFLVLAVYFTCNN